LYLAEAARLRLGRLTVRDWIGVPMDHSPLAVFAPEDGRHTQLVRLGRGVAHRRRRVLDSGDIGEIAADTCREHLVLERLAIREPRGNRVEDRRDLTPTRLDLQRAEQRHGLVVGPERDARRGVAVVQRGVGCRERRQNRRQEFVHIRHRDLPSTGGGLFLRASRDGKRNRSQVGTRLRPR
jgi:hypothetical protein